MQTLRKLAALLIGPAAIMAAGTMGAGTTGSLVLGGAWFRYGLLWVVLLTIPLFVTSVESASRIGLLNRNVGMFSLIRARLHPAVAWVIFIVLVPLHMLVSMSHMSILTASLLLLGGQTPPAPGAPEGYAHAYRTYELVLTALCIAGIYWMMASSGLKRLQKIMTFFVLVKVFTFFLVCMRGFTDLGPILAGFVPRLPPDLPTGENGVVRSSVTSMIAIVGGVLSPPAMLGISYMTADDSSGESPDLRKNLRSTIVNLGVLVGAYCLFIIIGSGYALYPLPNHASIDTIYGASRVLARAFPASLEFLGTDIFVIGLSMAATTTYIVVAQIMTYFTLDMFGKDWRQTQHNRLFHVSVLAWVIVPGLLAPFWTLPELLKVLLLMGFNTVVVPLAILIVMLFSNSRELMGTNRAGWVRNLLLAGAFVLAITLAILQLPPLLHALAS